jgi:predicted N-acetyltransferase YhbS
MVMLVPLSTIAPERVEALLDAAFGADRFGRTAYLLRQGMPCLDALSFAAVDGDALLGTIQCWPVALQAPGGSLSRLTLVGPVAVMPDIQRGGIGKAMMARMLKAAAEQGEDALIMIGDPEYYERFFGFSAAPTQSWVLPGPFERRRLLARITRQSGVPALGTIIPDPAFASQATNA